MGRKLGRGLCPLFGRGAGSPSNTVWPGPRPTCMPSLVLIRPTVWPQYTNVTVRQTDRQVRQQTDSIGRTVLQTVAQKRMPTFQLPLDQALSDFSNFYRPLHARESFSCVSVFIPADDGNFRTKGRPTLEFDRLVL